MIDSLSVTSTAASSADMSSSVFSSLLKRGRALVQQATGRRDVGRDLHGNTYYVQQEHSTEAVRRMVDYRDSGAAPHTVPMLWHSWLRGHRTEPPTLDELTGGRRAHGGAAAQGGRAEGGRREAESAGGGGEADEWTGREREADMSAASMLRELESQAAQDARWTGNSRNKRQDVTRQLCADTHRVNLQIVV